MSLKEINEHYRYSSQYESDIQPRTFLRYKDYILLNFPCYIEYNAATQKYYLIKNDYNKGNQSLYEYLLSAFHIEGMSELAIKHRDRIMLTDSPTGIVNVQPILEAIDAGKGIEFDYWSFNKQTKKHLVAIPYFLRTWERRWYLVAEPDNHPRTIGFCTRTHGEHRPYGARNATVLQYLRYRLFQRQFWHQS
jgi:predicted DNA-binding transcriptional regulator YafY